MPERTLDGLASETVRAAIASLTEAFRTAALPSPELDARLLVLDACGLSHEAYHLAPARTVSATEAECITAACVRRLAREPVSRILGTREFWGRRFALSPAVLDPRPDTETLIEAALEIVREESRAGTPLRILDLGTGSGCILLTLLAELPKAWGVGVDISASALAEARRNAAALGVSERAAFACGSWLDAVGGPFDLVLSNPPYIVGDEIAALEPEVRAHDPLLALDGGADGFNAYRVIAGGGEVIAPGGWLLLEAGAGQATGILNLLHHSCWTPAVGGCKILKDMAGIERVVAVKRQRVER